jgi:type IV secretion system protein TrbE
MDLLSGVLGSVVGIGATHGVRRWREDRRAPIGVADVLNWAFMVGDGVVLQKDGSLLAGWRYYGPDLAAASDLEMAALGRQVHDAILPSGDGWMFHVDAIRRAAAPYAESVFPNAVAAAIDAERRAAYERGGRRYETEYYFVATHRPDAELRATVGRAFVRGVGGRGVDWNAVVGRFERAIEELGVRLRGRLTIERLGGDALVTHLHECVTGLSHRVASAGVYLDLAVADQELVGGFEPKIGERHIRVVALTAFPPASVPGGLDFLGTLPFAYRWSTRLLMLGAQSGAAQIRRVQLRWFQKRRGLGAWVRDVAAKQASVASGGGNEELFQDQDAVRMTRDAAEAAAENASGAVRFCYCTQTVLVMERDAAVADDVARSILAACNDRGYGGRIETVNAVEAYVGSLPGHGYQNLRRALVSTRNAADLLPITSVWPGLAVNPSPLFPARSPPLLWAATTGSTPFRVNLHDSDVGHTLIVGKTGAGKSTLVGMLMAQFQRYAGAQCFLFDVGYSGRALCRAVGGRHYDVVAGGMSFQPLARIDDVAERVWAGEWVETCVEMQGVRVTTAMRGRIGVALELVAGLDVMHRTVSELLVQLQHPELVGAMRSYSVAGSYGGMLDGGADLEDASDTQVFELKSLLELDDRVLVPVLLHLFRRVERRLDGRPTLIVIEELWGALLRSSFAAKVREWLLTLRKRNAAVVLVAHSVAQVRDAPNASVLWESCPTRIFLPNADAAAPATAAVYASMGLGEREIAAIASAVPKRDYYFRSPRGGRVFELGVGEVARRALGGARDGER